MPEPEVQEIRVGYNLPAIYLDVARAMVKFCPIKHYEGADTESLPFMEQEHNALFGVMAVTIVFSYQSVEAFCNRYLYEIFERKDEQPERYQRLIHTMQSKGNSKSSQIGFNDVEKKPLEKKINFLCKAWNITTPCEMNPANWSAFLQIGRDMRNFIIHPKPQGFQESVRELMGKHKAGVYVEVAQNVLRSLSDEMGVSLPWIEQPKYMKGLGFQLIAPQK